MEFRRICLLCCCILVLSACARHPVLPEPAASAGKYRPSNRFGKQVNSPIAAASDAEADSDAATHIVVSDFGDDSEDLWIRIQRNLFFDRQLHRPVVRDRVDWHRENPAFLKQVAARAAPYLYHIVDRLEQRNLPVDLALLPIVESAFQPLAYSPSHAAGLWQIIPATAERFGLKQNRRYDGRRDVVTATEAALDYLALLQRQFDGDWQHALAAYNAGEARVTAAIARNQAAGKPTDFWSLALPSETRSYVPNLLALTELVAHPGKYGLVLQPIANQPYFVAVKTHSRIDLITAAHQAGLSQDKIYRLNSGLIDWATDSDEPDRVLVPVAKADQFKRALAGLANGTGTAWRRYAIQTGDSLARIAQRYNTSVAALKRINRLRGDLIHAGRSLRVPVAVKSFQQAAAGADAAPVARAESDRKIYTVQRGDTLWSMSNTYRVSIEQLIRWNGIVKQSLLQPGDKLVVRMDDRAGDSDHRFIPAVATESDGFECHGYTVQKGDSLWRIARRFNASIAELKRWNQLSKQGYLQPGQRLIVKMDDV